VLLGEGCAQHITSARRPIAASYIRLVRCSLQARTTAHCLHLYKLLLHAAYRSVLHGRPPIVSTQHMLTTPAESAAGALRPCQPHMPSSFGLWHCRSCSGSGSGSGSGTMPLLLTYAARAQLTAAAVVQRRGKGVAAAASFVLLGGSSGAFAMRFNRATMPML
jgi:hypothetical protein